MLPQAIGVAISPEPIIAVILMLFSQRARSNGLVFLLDWLLALAVVGSIVLILADQGKVSTAGTPSTLAYVLKLYGSVYQARGSTSYPSHATSLLAKSVSN